MPDEINLANVVQSTKDYDKFSYIGGNRKVSERHLKSLIHSLSEHPELAVARPVLVNKKFEIIDGQHRFEACRALGQPVYYTIANQADIAAARLLNAHQKNWNLNDYLESFAYSKRPQYVQLKELREEYPMPISALAAMCQGLTRWGGSASKRFMAGDFKLMKDKKLLFERLNQWKDLNEFIDFYNYDPVAFAFMYIQRVPEYDHDRMLQKLSRTKYEKQDSRRESMREFERVYNFDVRTDESFQRLF